MYLSVFIIRSFAAPVLNYSQISYVLGGKLFKRLKGGRGSLIEVAA